MILSIDFLNKVGLSLNLLKEAEEHCTSDSAVSFEFIYGVAVDGLSSFEMALKDKKEGEELVLSVGAAEASEFFGRNFSLLTRLLSLRIIPEIIHLHVKVISVKGAESHEVVQSIARAAASCSCGGSCGCS